MTTRTVKIADLPVTPWNNGGGTTRELLSWPPGTDRFDWRVSVASIAADGPFSVLPGIDRIITLIDGEGFRLCGAGVDHHLTTPYVPYQFDGETPLDCLRSGSGRSLALNVMTRRGRGRADVDILTGPSTTLNISHGMLISLTGDWEIGSQRLSPRTALWWARQPHLWRLQPGSPADRLAVITWHLQ